MAGEPVGIARTVPAFVMVPNPRQDRHDPRVLNVAEDPDPVHRVFLDLVELLGRELARLVEDVTGHTDLSHIVEQPGVLHELQLLGSQPQLAGEANCGRGDALGVAVRVAVFGVNGGDNRPDRVEEKILELRLQLDSVNSDPRLVPEERK